MDWRLSAALTIGAWGAYNIILKAVSGRMAWQQSMLWFVIGYAVSGGVFCVPHVASVQERFLQSRGFWPLLAGVLCGAGAILFFKTLPMAPGSVFLPLIGLYVLVSSVGCLVFLREPFSWRVGLGMVCATAAVILLGT